MNKFKSIPYQLLGSKKWIPAGTITEFIPNSTSAKIITVDIRNAEFDTKEKAYDFFVDHYINLGYEANKD